MIEQPLRLGRVRYINCEPIYYALERGIVPARCRIVDGTPAELNAQLASGELDVSVISSLEYVRHADRYLLLPDLAIACDGPVGSVLLLSSVPPTRLDGRPVLITDSSLTSAALIRLLLEKRYGVRPTFVTGPARAEDAGRAGIEAVVLIGDDALRAAGGLPHVLDLGEAWKELTGLPFVFALWAVREACYRIRPTDVDALHAALLRAKAYSTLHPEEICEATTRRVGLSREVCARYFSRCLSFDLTPRHLDGLRTFLSLLGQGGGTAFRFIG